MLFANFDHLDSSRLLWASASEPDRDRERLVRRAVETCLTDKQREVVTAHFFEGRSQSEIARTLGIRQQVVHKRIYGARRRGQIIGGALKRLADFLAPHLSP